MNVMKFCKTLFASIHWNNAFSYFKIKKLSGGCFFSNVSIKMTIFWISKIFGKVHLSITSNRSSSFFWFACVCKGFPCFCWIWRDLFWILTKKLLLSVTRTFLLFLLHYITIVKIIIFILTKYSYFLSVFVSMITVTAFDVVVIILSLALKHVKNQFSNNLILLWMKHTELNHFLSKIAGSGSFQVFSCELCKRFLNSYSIDHL